MIKSKNIVELCGSVGAAPEISHYGQSEIFYIFPIIVKRLSGTTDSINVIIRQSDMNEELLIQGRRINVTGELRSFNNKSGVGSRLVITVFAKQIEAANEETDKNTAQFTGTICKAPTLRVTPMGREICDIMLAVNRRYGRSDYLPCITWGKTAQRSSKWTVGTQIELSGRIQSRNYIKTIDGVSMEKTAFEVSASQINIVEE